LDEAIEDLWETHSATILEFKGCPKWRVVKEGEATFLHCPTTQTRIPITLGDLPEGASFEEGDADLPTGTELIPEVDITAV
jgi:hypothetical protein